MKNILCTIVLLASTSLSFAQAKVRFENDTSHLVYLNPDASMLLPADAGLAGQPVPSNGGLLPSGVTLVADLWGGESPSDLFLVASTSFKSGGVAGLFTAQNIALPNPIRGGINPAFFQVQIHDANDSSASGAAAAGDYYGLSEVFTCYYNSGTAYYSIVNPTYSTWDGGTYPLDNGAFGAIELQATVPEPTTSSLVCLAVASLTVMRRRR